MTGDEKKAIHKCIHLKKFGIHTHTHTHKNGVRAVCALHYLSSRRKQFLVSDVQENRLETQ